MNSLINSHTSLLAYLQSKAQQLGSELGTTFTVVNFDAYTDLGSLPEGDILGIGDFAFADNSDEPLETLSVILMAGTVNDPNNMRLIKIVSSLYEDLRPEKTINYINESTGLKAGLMICYGETLVLPVEKNLATKILQGVSLMAAVNTD